MEGKGVKDKRVEKEKSPTTPPKPMTNPERLFTILGLLTKSFLLNHKESRLRKHHFWEILDWVSDD